MASPLLREVRGPDASRVRELMTRSPKPLFCFGELVRDAHGEIGAIDAIYADLEAALDAGVIDDDWLDEQQIRPRTKPSETWYSVVLGNGAVLCGERDLTRASAARTSTKTKPTAKTKTKAPAKAQPKPKAKS